MPYGTRPLHVQHQKSAGDTLATRLRAWRERENLSQSEAALRLNISKRTLQQWEQDRAEPHGLGRAAVENAMRA